MCNIHRPFIMKNSQYLSGIITVSHADTKTGAYGDNCWILSLSDALGGTQSSFFWVVGSDNRHQEPYKTRNKPLPPLSPLGCLLDSNLAGWVNLLSATTGSVRSHNPVSYRVLVGRWPSYVYISLGWGHLHLNKLQKGEERRGEMWPWTIKLRGEKNVAHVSVSMIVAGGNEETLFHHHKNFFPWKWTFQVNKVINKKVCYWFTSISSSTSAGVV